MYPSIFLQKNKQAILERKHPWIFSGALQKPDEAKENGIKVFVRNSKNAIVATGHYQNFGSISVRVLSFDRTEINEAFYTNRIKNALTFRKKIELPNTSTNCFRLIHGEGDHLSGLIVDVYNTAVVIQAHSHGMWNDRMLIAKAIDHVLQPDTIVMKSALQANDKTTEYYKGDAKNAHVSEYDVRFAIDILEGQKTGFFLDQRENRALVASFCKDKSVLNTYCYSGGFSLYALHNGAHEVHSVDVSKSAMQLLERNIVLNNFDTAKHTAHVQDVFEFLKASDKKFDIVILDPPAFAKNISSKHNAVQAYKRLNIAGIHKLKSNSLLFTFSCSQVIDKQLFYNTVTSAVMETGRNCRVLQHLSQGADHPVNMYHPEGSYLKGLLLYIE